MRKAIALLLIILVVLSCSKDSNETEEVTNNSNSNIIKLQLEAFEQLDVSSLGVLSIGGETTIDNEGNFQYLRQESDNSKLPVILKRNAQIVLGYFPETIKDNTITKDDILTFFFNCNPNLAIYNFQKEDIKNSISKLQAYTELIEKMVSIINANKSPLADADFVNLIFDNSQEIISDKITSKSSKSKLTESYSFNYHRDGKIEWPSKSPVYCALGVEITDFDSNQVMTPQIIKPNNLVFSPGSLPEKIYTHFVDSNPNPNDSFQLSQNSSYTLSFTNGNRNDVGDLNAFVQKENARLFASQILSFAMPIDIITISKYLKCQNLKEKFTVLVLMGLNEGVNVGDVLSVILDTRNDIKEIQPECYTEQRYFEYIKFFIDLYEPFLSRFESGSELARFIIEYFGSDIKGQEIRHFKDGISVGFLEQNTISDVAFEGQKGDAFTFETSFKEREIKYNFQTSSTSLKFTSEENLVSAQDLPFTYTINGDAQVNTSNPITTDHTGKLTLNFVAKEKDSEINIMPQFSSPRVSEIPIVLKIKTKPNTIDIIGKWRHNYNFNTDQYFQTEDDVPNDFKGFYGIDDIEFFADGTMISESRGSGTYEFNDNVLTYEFNFDSVSHAYFCDGDQIWVREDRKIVYSGTIDVVGIFRGVFTRSLSYDNVCPSNGWNDNYSSITVSSNLIRK
ncbi:hypothetical protein [Hyunsoonleella pacifica]|uniref:Uncharacterized protein n=1 Tax=Hyunsoonleella pacifica TaxID=1080224 RepID=A0A4Q9FSG3_9FLAO|nr:hypothetical protein [Hyunsoonleella pacifica]TBN17796.1 hypothetical protein EYD46_05650 [Hyunsoonleella pacifica]GGD08893.1 hypothetical protein GCM10011368_08520 [Hyunsoonleella pacifica]